LFYKGCGKFVLQIFATPKIALRFFVHWKLRFLVPGKLGFLLVVETFEFRGQKALMALAICQYPYLQSYYKKFLGQKEY